MKTKRQWHPVEYRCKCGGVMIVRKSIVYPIENGVTGNCVQSRKCNRCGCKAKNSFVVFNEKYNHYTPTPITPDISE